MAVNIPTTWRIVEELFREETPQAKFWVLREVVMKLEEELYGGGQEDDNIARLMVLAGLSAASISSEVGTMGVETDPAKTLFHAESSDDDYDQKVERMLAKMRELFYDNDQLGAKALLASMNQSRRDDILESIARKCAGIKTLEVRNMDALDFYSLSVSTVERMLVEAYNAGRASNAV